MGTLGAGVMALGTTQQLLAIATIVLVFTHHRWATRAAVFVGFGSAVGFTLVHLMPKWFGTFSDSFINAPASARVTGFSWFAAIFEISSALAIAIAGLLARGRQAL
ncbi:hypothetical protein GPX89_27255 [Nocardia sp. ET3-3]|uniref:Uncharacterized protein n=2 Tax=Nocardia terrae TaxID=2675851 RepID=A0A7K1V2V8_9NOCA|nr:hypothetical protein [Nocardia terrae]